MLVVVRLTPIFRAFEIFILTTIFANCIALAVSTPYPGNDSNRVNAILVSYCIFNVVYYVSNSNIMVVHSSPGSPPSSLIDNI